MIDILNFHVLAAWLTHLHEVDIVLKKRSIKNRKTTCLVTDISNCEHVLERYWLTTDKVCTCLYTNISYILRTDFADTLTEKIKVIVALEWIIRLWNKTLLLNEFFNCSTTTSSMSLSCSEVEVHESYLTRSTECLSEDIFTSTTLVSRKDVLATEHFLNCSLNAEECLSSSISIISTHHCSELEVRHSVNT